MIGERLEDDGKRGHGTIREAPHTTIRYVSDHNEVGVKGQRGRCQWAIRQR